MSSFSLQYPARNIIIVRPSQFWQSLTVRGTCIHARARVCVYGETKTFSFACRKVTLNGCYGINTNDNKGECIPGTIHTALPRIYMVFGTAIARQPRSSVLAIAAIYIVFIALRAVSIHFYHCYTIYSLQAL